MYFWLPPVYYRYLSNNKDCYQHCSQRMSEKFGKDPILYNYSILLFLLLKDDRLKTTHI